MKRTHVEFDNLTLKPNYIIHTKKLSTFILTFNHHDVNHSEFCEIARAREFIIEFLCIVHIMPLPQLKCTFTISLLAKSFRTRIVAPRI